MFSRSSWLHLRIPFSYYLLPIFLFALAVSPNYNGSRIFWVFFIVHFLLYPASNAYNSYFDKDEKSIGGLKNPPPVKPGLYYLALTFDLLAIMLGLLLINVSFAFMLLIYGLVSKSYSHPSIRLKKHPVIGWIIAGFFQGLFTLTLCYVGINDFPIEIAMQPTIMLAGLLSSIMLWANYPMTQVYQHEEDSMRGDRTLSIMLGIRGTFYFVMGVFLVATIGFVWYFNTYFEKMYGYIFLWAIFPVIIYFLFWFLKVLRNREAANYTYTMWLNFISASCLIIFFIYLFLDSTQILQVFQ